ncbi:hypothetical protein LJR296_008229 [Cupriavidus necator]|uniref:hypothetical protein n=1 Tax=Cupriavidus necator TaxID=106590 RepID=UPI003ED113C7
MGFEALLGCRRPGRFPRATRALREMANAALAKAQPALVERFGCLSFAALSLGKRDGNSLFLSPLFPAARRGWFQLRLTRCTSTRKNDAFIRWGQFEYEKQQQPNRRSQREHCWSDSAILIGFIN